MAARGGLGPEAGTGGSRPFEPGPANEPQTERAQRSLASHLAPVAVLVLGLLYVGVAVSRLDAIYDGDPGIYRAAQVAPGLVAGVRDIRSALRELRDLATGSDLAGGPCATKLLASICRPTLATRSPDHGERVDALEAAGRALVSGPGGPGRTTDVNVAHWDDGRSSIVVMAVARFASPSDAASALVTSAAGGDEVTVGHPVARTTWLAGKRLLIGVLVSADDRATTDRQLITSRHQAAAGVGLARVGWYEMLAIGPLLIVFVALGAARTIVLLAFVALFVVLALAALVVIIPASVAVLAWLWLFRRRRKAAKVVAPPADLPGSTDGPMVRQIGISVPSAWQPGEHDRDAFLAVIVLIGFGIAAFTRSLFPASLAWGSLLLAAIGRPPLWARDLRHTPTLRKALWVILAVATAALFAGLVPGLLGDARFLVVLVPLGIAVLLGRWRELTQGTELAYAKWYEDVDGRSTLFLFGVALLMLGAGSLFLASTGNVALRAQLAEKAFAIVGLAVAMQAAASVRASRDAARRDKARERGTPPVLYLRSFGDDGLKVVSPRLQRAGLERLAVRRKELFEDVVARALSRIGPVVAIAKPGTGQRDLGPARDSIVTSDWLGAVKAYMGEAVLVALVIGSSDGLVRELDTLGELGLLDRLCVFVPPVGAEEVARRLAILGSHGYSDTWGTIRETEKNPLVALISIDGQHAVVSASRRTANAYRKCAANLPEVKPVVQA